MYSHAWETESTQHTEQPVLKHHPNNGPRDRWVCPGRWHPVVPLQLGGNVHMTVQSHLSPDSWMENTGRKNQSHPSNWSLLSCWASMHHPLGCTGVGASGAAALLAQPALHVQGQGEGPGTCLTLEPPAASPLWLCLVTHRLQCPSAVCISSPLLHQPDASQLLGCSPQLLAEPHSWGRLQRASGTNGKQDLT